MAVPIHLTPEAPMSNQTMFVPSDRDRLLLAFADAERHGIAAREDYAADERSGREGLRDALRRATPYGIGSYVFSTWPEHRFFDEEGRLIAELTVHTSGEESARAVMVILAAHGFDDVRAEGADLLVDTAEVAVGAG
jgi:hypothetical protein